MRDIANAVIVLVFLVGVFWLMLGRGRSSSGPGEASRAWSAATAGSESLKLGPGLIAVKGILAAFAIAELSGKAGDSAIAVGSALAIATVAMMASRFIYLVAGIGFSLLGYVAAISPILEFLGVTGVCEFAIPVVGRFAILGLFLILFALSAVASVLMRPSVETGAGVLSAGLALFGSVSVLLYLANMLVMDSLGPTLILGIIGALVLGAASPIYPNLVEVVTGTALIGMTFLWTTVSSDVSCLATRLDFSLLVSFFGVGLVCFALVRVFRNVIGGG